MPTVPIWCSQFRPRTEGAEYLTLMVLPSIVTVVEAGGLSCAEAGIAQTKHRTHEIDRLSSWQSVGRLPKTQPEGRIQRLLPSDFRLLRPFRNLLTYGASDAVYAAIASRSSLVNLATTGIINSVHTPFRALCCMS